MTLPQNVNNIKAVAAEIDKVAAQVSAGGDEGEKSVVSQKLKAHASRLRDIAAEPPTEPQADRNWRYSDAGLNAINVTLKELVSLVKGGKVVVPEPVVAAPHVRAPR